MDSVIQALGEQTRRRILLAVQGGRGEELTVDQVAAAAGIHRTVAFTHLETLARAGLLERGQRRGRRGRPPFTYRATEAAEFSHPPRQFRLLATLLATAVRESAAPDSARRLGVAYGRQIGTLEGLGGDFEFDGEQVRARNCIFGEACAVAREVVCGLQAGIVEGVLGRQVQALGPDGAGGCLYVMNVAGAA